jgi:hypothetical protein
MNSYTSRHHAQAPFPFSFLHSPDSLGGIPERSEKRISDDGNKEQNAALEETGASQAPAYEVKHKEQSKSKESAKRGGRPYPNLVDNMNAAKKQRRKRSKKEA